MTTSLADSVDGCFFARPAGGPVADGLDDHTEILAFLGQMVFDADRGFRIDHADHDPLGFELLEPFGKESVAQTWDRVGNIAEASFSAQQGARKIAPVQRRPISSTDLWNLGQKLS